MPSYIRIPKFFSSAQSLVESTLAFLSYFSQVISQYLQSTHAPTHSDYTMTLLDLFEVEKEGEKEAFREDLHNRSESNFGFGKTLLAQKCSYRTYKRESEEGVSFFMLMTYLCRTTEYNNTGFSLGCFSGMVPG